MKFFSRKRANHSFRTSPAPAIFFQPVNFTSALGLLIVLLLGCACSSGQGSLEDQRFDGQELVLGKQGIPEQMAFTDVYRTLEVVPLENHAEAKLERINKIIYNEDWIVVLLGRGREIFIFDREGNYIQKIEAEGKYNGMNLADVTFSDNDSTFYYLNTSSQQIVEYYPFGGIRKTIDVPFHRVWAISLTPEQEFLVFSPLSENQNSDGKPGLTNRFAFLSKENGQILKSLSYDIAPEIPEIIQGMSFGNAGDNSSFKPPYSDTIYHIAGKRSFEPHLIINAPGGEIIYERKSKLYVGFSPPRGPYLFEGHLENDKFLFYIYSQGVRTYRVIIDKETEKYHHLPTQNPIQIFGPSESGLQLIDDKHSLKFFPNFYNISQSSGEEDMMHVSAAKFLKFLAQAEGNIPSFFETSSPERLRHLEAGSNPVLLIAKY